MRMAQCSVSLENGLKLCLLESWTMMMQSQGLARVTDVWPFQDHLGTKTIILTQSCILGDLINEYSELRHPQSHQGKACSRPSCNYNYCLDLKLCLPEDLNKHAEASPVSLTNGLFRTIFLVKLSLTQSSVPQVTWMNVHRLSECHWWMAFSRSPCQENYSNDSKLSPRRPEHAEPRLPHCHQQMAFSRPSSY